MKHAKALGIKFVFTTIILLVLFTVFDTANIWQILVISVLFTVLSYLLGDLLILRKFGHLVAALSDLVLSFVALWLLGMIIISDFDRLLLAAGVSALLLTICEALFHSHLSNNVMKIKGSKSPEQREREEQRKQGEDKREERAQERGLEDREK